MFHVPLRWRNPEMKSCESGFNVWQFARHGVPQRHTVAAGCATTLRIGMLLIFGPISAIYQLPDPGFAMFDLIHFEDMFLINADGARAKSVPPGF